MRSNHVIKFLLVDDIDANLLALEGLLRRPGLKLLKAHSGAEALELLLLHEVALALVDVQMPGMDGLELARLMRGTERTRLVPIIFLTAGTTDDKRSFDGYEAGGVDYLVKPIEPHILQNKANVFLELARHREGLRESEEFSRSLMDGSADCVKVLDTEGRLLLMNAPGLCQMEIDDFGPLCGTHWASLWPEETADIVRQSVERARAGDTISFEAFWPSAKGTPKWWEVNVSPVRSAPRGDIVRLLAVSRDISDRKRNQQILLEARDKLTNQAEALEELVAERTAELTATNKQLEAFVYSIAHDLRAPLRAMQGFSTLLLDDAGPALSEASRNFATRIEKSAQFMDALLQDLLAFSQIGQQHFQLGTVSLKSAVSSVIDQLQPDVKKMNGRIENTGPWPFVFAHEATLTQVLFSLVSNALKFILPGRSPLLRLWTEERGDLIRVCVEDNGIGIAPEHQEQIFRLFTRLYGEKYPGTGVGLAIVQKGVERMGGAVGVESATGKGSKFWFELRKAK